MRPVSHFFAARKCSGAPIVTRLVKAVVIEGACYNRGSLGFWPILFCG